MTFVLVHGGWHGGWCWRKLLEPLRGTGRRVFTPTLTGLGERAHLASPSVGLGTHIEDVRAVLEQEDVTRAVLVGHSSSGAVISGVAAACPERVSRLVYLDAFVPEVGESVMDLVPPARREFFERLARESGDGWRIPLDRDAAIAGWGVTDPVDVAWLRPRLRPQPLAPLADPLPPPGPPPDLPASYVHCLRGPTVATFTAFAERARARPGRWETHELDAGHDAMITAPGELAGILTGVVTCVG